MTGLPVLWTYQADCPGKCCTITLPSRVHYDHCTRLVDLNLASINADEQTKVQSTCDSLCQLNGQATRFVCMSVSSCGGDGAWWEYTLIDWLVTIASCSKHCCCGHSSTPFMTNDRPLSQGRSENQQNQPPSRWTNKHFWSSCLTLFKSIGHTVIKDGFEF